MSKLKVFLVCLIFGLGTGSLSAQTAYTWNGGTGDWDVATNWTPEGVPGSLDTAIVGSGTISLTGDVTVANLEIAANLNGDFDLEVTNLMVWNGQSIQGSGTLTISTNATLRLAGGNQQTLRRDLVNNGTIIWEAGNFALFDAITVTNYGSFLDQHSGTEPFSGGIYGCTFINDGTYTKTTSGVTSLTIPLSNNGSLELEAGEMQLNYYGTSNGTISVAENALLNIQGTSWDITGPVSGEGMVEFWSATTIRGSYDITGSTRFASSTILFDTSAIIINLNHGQELVISGTAEFNTGDPLVLDSLYLSGNLQGSDSVAIMELLNWAGGTMQGSGTTNITSGATLRLSGGNQQTLRRNVVNNGTTIWEAGNFYLDGGNTFTNNGSFVDEHSGTEPFSGGLYGCSFINDGTYTKTGTGLSQLTIPFYNTTNGNLQGIGSISMTYGFSNQGSVSPGDSLGSLNLTVDYPTTTTSDLNIEIGGTKVDSLYDQLNINGDATLGGTLNITLVNDFMPVLGDTFVIMTYNTYTGEFSDINGLNTGSGVSFEFDVGSTDIKLITIETPNGAPSVFSLLAPVDEVVLSEIDTLNFLWQASSDVDEDELDYTLIVFGGALDTTIANITDTTFTIIDREIWQGNTEYKWTVLASDGINTTASPDTFSFTSPILDNIFGEQTLLPIRYNLEQNYPNPFNPTTKINYELRITDHVELNIYDLLGKKVVTLISKVQEAGQHQVKWDASGFACGIYYYQINTGKFQDVKKMVLLR